jgi:hypothetical protein
MKYLVFDSDIEELLRIFVMIMERERYLELEFWRKTKLTLVRRQ